MKQRSIRNYFDSGIENDRNKKAKTITEKDGPSGDIETNANRFQIYDREKRKRPFLEIWKNEFPWVEFREEEQKMYCKWCREVPNLADKKSPLLNGAGGTAQGFRKETLQTHDVSKCHEKCKEAVRAKSNPTKTAMAVAVRKMNSANFEKMKQLFNTAYYIVKENLAFSKFKSLCELQIKNTLDLGHDYFNDHACKNFVLSIAHTLQNELTTEIKGTNFITVIADGTSDRSALEQEAIYVRYVQNGESVTKLAGFVAVDDANSEGIHKCILRGLLDIGISESVLEKKLVGLNLDGAATNMGIYNGVQAMFKVKYPHLIVVHCINHMLELGVLDTKKNESYMAIFESTIKQVFSFYHWSPKRQRELARVAEMLEIKLLKYGGIQNIRWVASQARALKSLVLNFNATLLHLEDIAQRSKKESATAKNLLKTLRSDKLKKTLLFLLDFLSIIGILSEMYQAENLLIFEATSKLELALLQLVELKSQPGFFQREHKNLIDDCDEDINPIFAADFIDSTVEFLDTRFKQLQEPPVLYFRVFDFTEWPSEKQLLISFGNQNIQMLFEYFICFFTGVDKETICQEWVALKFKIHNILKHQKTSALRAQAIYKDLMQQNDPQYSNILCMVELMFSLSGSTAVVERGFSAMNIQKNTLRSGLKQDTLNAIMSISLNGKPLSDFCAETAVNHWLHCGSGKRHI